MRLLLDESVPVQLRNHLPGHQVSTVGEMGWHGTKIGLLLARAARRFDALITTDKNMRHQQNLQSLPLAVVVLSAKSNTLHALVPLTEKLNAVLKVLVPRTLNVVK